MIEIDGSHGEGGGQIIRTALALSAATGKPFRATNIRHGRQKPGLKAQHVAAIKALQKLCNATAIDATIGSETLEFYPKQIKSCTINGEVGTAGSTMLVLQSLLLPAMLVPRVKIKLKGGTDVPFAPQTAYINHVILPQLRKFADIELKLLRRGYMTAQGEIEITIKQKDPLPIELVEKGELQSIRGISHASLDLQSRTVAERQASGTKHTLPIQPRIETTYSQSETGSGITLFASFATKGEVSHLNPVILGASMLGKKSLPAEDVGKQAAEALVQEISSPGCTDKYAADQLLPFLAWFGGSYTATELTPHFHANKYAIEQFLPNTIGIEGNLIKKL